MAKALTAWPGLAHLTSVGTNLTLYDLYVGLIPVLTNLSLHLIPHTLHSFISSAEIWRISTTMSPALAIRAVIFLFLALSDSLSATPHDVTCQKIEQSISSMSHVYYQGQSSSRNYIFLLKHLFRLSA